MSSPWSRLLSLPSVFVWCLWSDSQSLALPLKPLFCLQWSPDCSSKSVGWVSKLYTPLQCHSELTICPLSLHKIACFALFLYWPALSGRASATAHKVLGLKLKCRPETLYLSESVYLNNIINVGIKISILLYYLFL